MRYSNIGSLKSSKIILGTDYYGTSVTKDEAFRLIDFYRANGGNHIDTAKIYGDGRTEPLLGEWIKLRGRDGMIIATKGAHPNFDTMQIPRLSEREIESDLDASLMRLGVDYIDLYWLHRDGESVAAGEIIESMNRMVKKGKIREFGCSNWKSRRIAEANGYAEEHGIAGFAASQIKFSPAVTSPAFCDDPTLVEMDDNEFDFYADTGMPVMAFAPQAKGFFSKMAAGGEAALSEKARERYMCGENLERLEYIKRLSQKYGCSVAGIVCALLASIIQADIFPIAGGKTEAQLAESLEGADLEISAKEAALLFKYSKMCQK